MNASFWDDTSWSAVRSELPANNGDDNAEKPGTAAWFKEIERDIVNRSGGKLIKEPDTVKYDDRPLGRELWIALADNETNRVVRIYVIRGKIYYLSVQAMNLVPHDDLAQVFFRSFEALNAKP